MDSTILSLLSAFLLSILGLFAFIWSLRKGLLIENPAGALVATAEHAMQAAAQTDRALESTERAEINDRIDADRSSAFPVFMFIVFACFWLLVGSAAGGIASIKLHEPDWLVQQAWFTFGRHHQVIPCGLAFNPA